MDQTHASEIGEWDPNSFVNDQWDHHQFGGSTLTFDPNHGHHAPDNGFHTPDAFTSAQMNPQLSAPDTQPGLYRQFEFYQQPQSDVWSGQVSSGGQYGGQEASLPQSFYAGQQPSAEAGQTVDSRFSLVGEYQNHHLPVQENQETLSHGFGGHVPRAQPQTQAPDNFLHGNVAHSHWGQRIPTPTSGYLPNREYENPLANPQAINLQPQAARSSPSPFTAGHGPVSGPVQPYQVSHQPVESRQAQPQSQFVQPINGQPMHNRASIAQLPVARNTGSPHGVSQPMVLGAGVHVSQVPPPQSQSQPKPKAQPNSQAQLPAQPITSHLTHQQFAPAQPQVIQQYAPSAPSPETNSAAGVKRRPISEVQESKVIAKKTKVTPSTSNTGSPSTVASVPDALPPTSPFIVDEKLLGEARKQPLGTWQGVPNLAIGETPTKLKKGPPTKRYVVIATKGGRDPLLPNLARGWTPAESLGNHADAYQNASNDLDRQRADTRLEIEMKRGGNEIPSDWWKKMPRGDTAADAKRMDPPPEPINTAIKASESLRIHPAHKSNHHVLLDTFDDYYPLVLEKATELKNSPELDRLGKLAKIRTKNPASFDPAEFETLRRKLEPLRKQLENAIDEGLRNGDARVLQKMGEKSSVPVRLLNILINLINVGDANSSLAKAILRLWCGFTSVKKSQLEAWKFPSTKAKLEAQGDAEVKDLIAAIFVNAEKNTDKDVTADLKSLKDVGLSGEVKRAPKVATRVPSGSLGAKRAREDDGSDNSRSSKKTATESKPSATALASISNGKTSAGSVKTSTIKPPSSKGPTTAPSSSATILPPKARSGLLLPGKTRPAVKPALKSENVKAEALKGSNSAKHDVVSKPQPTVTKVEAPKPTISRPQVPLPDSVKSTKPKVSEPPKPSRFASLLAEIAEPKKVVAPTPPPVAAPDPNETEQQKVRRLRKEERRRLGLKVAFKGEDRLVEIREFTRHPDEIAFTTSGVGEVKSENKNKMEEGMALKKSHAGEIRPWEEPLGVDFSDIPQSKREQTFVTRGGVRTFATDQQRFTDDRESKELMAIYTDRSDIPPTPKSPNYEPVLSYDDATDGSVVDLPGVPDYNEVRQRGIDQVKQGFWRALYAAQARLESQSNADYSDFTKALKSVSSIAQTYNGNGYPTAMETAPAATAAAPAQPEVRIEMDPALANLRDQKTYELLISDLVKNFKDLNPYDPLRPKTTRRRDYPDPHLQRVVDFIEDIVESLRRSESGLPEPEPTPPAAATVAQPAAQDYSAAWAQYYAQQGQQPQQPQQQPQVQQQWYSQQSAYTQAANPYLQAQTGQPANPQQNADLSAIISAFGGQHPQQGAAAADPAQLQALIAALSQPQAGQPAMPGLPSGGTTGDDLLLSVMKMVQQGGGANPAPAAAPYGGAYAYPSGQQGPPVHPDRERELRECDRDRDRERDHHHNNNNPNPRGKKQNRERDRDTDGSGDIPEHLRGINRSLIGTKQCTFWARGQCAKGDKCTFRHD